MRPLSSSNLSLLAGVAAIVATFAFVHEVTEDSWTTHSLPSAGARPPSDSTAPYPSDDRGFLNSSARCAEPLALVTAARTDAALVAICLDPKGEYEYHGVRLSDGAALSVPAEASGGREFVANNDGVTYSLSAKQLVITKGDNVIRREPVIEYREPRTYPAELPPGG